MQRRRAIAVLAALPLFVAARVAFAGSYLDRSVMLLSGARKDVETLRAKMTDKELARIVRAVAEARQSSASDMDVPAVVAKAHPHLLLALTKVERAARSAIDGNYATVLEYIESFKREETIFRSQLKEAGHPLPAGDS
ncbi:MAG: hypothetical protein HOW73_51280 [Polyangiaceae bacterium]|nr:hypothetical protein [Polyangiaceae bacterium]